jgi:hypothetical protein
MVTQTATKYEFGTKVMVKPHSQAQVVFGVFAPEVWRVLKETAKGFIAVRESDWEFCASQAQQSDKDVSEVVSDSLASYLPKECVAEFDEQAYKKLSTLAKQVEGLRRKAGEIWSHVLEG